MDELTNIFIKDSRQVYLSNIVTGGVQSLMVAAGVKAYCTWGTSLWFFLLR